jgi:hypothetical protein
MATSAQNLAALRRELARVGGRSRRNPEVDVDSLEGFTYLNLYEEEESVLGDLVNGDAIEGFAARVVGRVKHPPKDMFAASVLIVHGGKTFRVSVFDDEAVYEKVLYKRIPDRKTAEMLAKATYNSMNHYAGYFGRDYLEAAKKYGA